MPEPTKPNPAMKAPEDTKGKPPETTPGDKLPENKGQPESKELEVKLNSDGHPAGEQLTAAQLEAYLVKERNEVARLLAKGDAK